MREYKNLVGFKEYRFVAIVLDRAQNKVKPAMRIVFAPDREQAQSLLEDSLGPDMVFNGLVEASVGPLQDFNWNDALVDARRLEYLNA